MKIFNFIAFFGLITSLAYSQDQDLFIPGNIHQSSTQFGGWTKAQVEMGYASIQQNRLQTYSTNEANSAEEENYIDGIRPINEVQTGCVVSSLGMMLEYFDRVQGFSDLPFSATADRNLYSDFNMMTNSDHYNDYFLPEDAISNIIPDKSEDPNHNRPDSCLADVIKTSQSLYHCPTGVTNIGEAQNHLPTWIKTFNSSYSFSIEWIDVNIWYVGIGLDQGWEIYKAEIDAGQPVLFPMNSQPGTKGVDHAVIGIGYKTENGERFYACYNTWDKEISYYPFADDSDQYAGGFDSFLISKMEIKIAQASDFSADTLYRFRRDATGAYFFSANPQEVANVVNTLSKEWAYEGPVFKVETTENPAQSIVPVYRFYNSFAAAHFYTASESERDNVIANLSDVFHYEGVAFYAYAGQLPGTYPVYRFYLPRTRSHFFTLDEAEKQHIIDNVDPSYMVYEGVAWYGRQL